MFLSPIIAVVMVLTDLFRDRALNGWAKAAWTLFLVFVPLLTSLVYLIARGGTLSDRINDQASVITKNASGEQAQTSGGLHCGASTFSRELPVDR